jgi:hypothetical protein
VPLPGGDRADDQPDEQQYRDRPRGTHRHLQVAAGRAARR